MRELRTGRGAEPCRSVFGPGFGAGGGGGGGSVTITNQITEITASGLSEDPGQVLAEGTDGGALLTGDGIRTALDAALGGPGWRAPEAERLLSYDVPSRTVGILGGTGVALPLATEAAAGLMSAADKQALAAAGGAGGVATEPTRAGLAAVTVAPGVATVRTSGHALPGDGGGGLYRRTAGEPAHGGKVQSADGAWWELVAEGGRVNVLQFGAARTTDGTTPTVDAHAAFAAAIRYAGLWSAGTVALGLAVEVPPGRYRIAAPLEIRAAMTLRGQGGLGLIEAWPTEIRFDDTAGIIVHDARSTGVGNGVETPDDPATTSAAGAVIEGLWLSGPGAGAGFDPAKPGIRVRARCLLRDLHVGRFSGHGVHIEADAAGTGTNANVWTAINLAARGNGGSGLHVAGTDANAGHAFGLDLSENGRWGLEDRSFLGNHYAGVQTAANGTGTAGQDGASAIVRHGGDLWCAAAGASEAALAATEPGTDPAVWVFAFAGGSVAIGPESAPAWTPGQPAGTWVAGGAALLAGASNRSVVLGLYVEEDQGLAALDQRTMALGGQIGRVAPGLFGRGYAQSGRDVDAGSGLRFQPSAAGFEVLLRDAPAHALTLVTQGTPDGLRLMHDPGLAGGLVSWKVRFDSAIAQAFTLDETTAAFGRPGPVGRGHALFPRGAFHGDFAHARQLVFGPDARTGEDHGPGDLVLASAPAAGAAAGWLWLSAHDADGAAGTARALWTVPTLDGAVTLPGYAEAALAAAGAAGHAGTLAFATGRGAPMVSDGGAWRDLRAMTVATVPGDAVLAPGHAFALLRMTSSAANTVTVPAGALGVGEQATILQSGTGQTTVVAGAGVTIGSEVGLALRGRHAAASLLCLAPDTYLLVGALAPA